MRKSIIQTVLMLLVGILLTPATSVQAARKQKKAKLETSSKNDSTETSKKKGLVSYDKVITSKARNMQGFITVH